MIVIADTSVLLNVAFTRSDHILVELFDEVWVPEAVAAEFLRLATSGGRFGGLVMPGACKVKQVQNVPEAFTANPRLDRGEIEALALALQEKADAVLLDEVNARDVAKHLGITAIGTLGLLLMARKLGLIPTLAPVLRKLIVEGNFRLSTDLVTEALRKAGELP